MSELPPMSELDEITPSPVEPTPPITPPSPAVASTQAGPITHKLKKVLFIALGLIVGLVIIGTIYRATRPQSGVNTPTPTPAQQVSTPTTTPTQVESATLRLGSLALAYPSNWQVLFSPIVDAKTPNITPLYFVRSESEYLEHAQCASTGSCTAAPLMLKFSGNTAIWTGYSLVDFLRTTDPSFPIDKLADTQYGELQALAGYTDLAELNYTVVIRTSDTTYQTIELQGREDTRDLLDAMITKLAETTTLPDQLTDPSALGEKYTYTIKVSARLTTGEYNILNLILSNVLAPKTNAINPSYFLYTEGATGYPSGNYLDYTYYLMTDNPELESGDYSSSQVTITLTAPPSDNFSDYLLAPKYCQSSSDCVYRAEFCTFDAYNRYHLFRTPWGCEGAEYTGLGNSESLSESLSCREGIDVTYDSLECVENSCVAHNPVPACREY